MYYWSFPRRVPVLPKYQNLELIGVLYIFRLAVQVPEIPHNRISYMTRGKGSSAITGAEVPELRDLICDTRPSRDKSVFRVSWYAA